MATNLSLVMRRHLKLKKAMSEFRDSKNSFTGNEVNTIIKLNEQIEEMETMMMVFVPKKLVENLLKEVMKL